MHGTISTAAASTRHLAVAEFDASVPEIGEHIGTAFATVGAWLARHGIAPMGPPLAHYTITSAGFHVRAGFEVPTPVPGDDRVHSFDLDEGTVVTTLHLGPYTELTDTYDAVRTYAAGQGLHLDESSMWEEYLSGPEATPDQTRTNVLWPVRA